MSIVPKETIEVIAQSVGIPTIPADVSAALAPDVEYRLREIMQVRPLPPPESHLRPSFITPTTAHGHTELSNESVVAGAEISSRQKSI